MHPIAIVALTLIGVVLVYAIGISFVEWRTQRAIEHTKGASQHIQRDQQARYEEIQREAAERREQRAVDDRAREAERLRVIAEREAAADTTR